MPLGGDDVILLDEDAVVQAQPVVGSAAAFDGVFLRHSQSRQCLAGVEDDRAGFGDRIHVEPRPRSDRRQQLDEIERGALRREQGARGSDDFAKLLSGPNDISILREPAYFRLGR